MTRWRGNTVMLKGKKPNQRKQGKRHCISAFQSYMSSDSSWWMNFHRRGKGIWELLQIFLPMPSALPARLLALMRPVGHQSQAIISWLPAPGLRVSVGWVRNECFPQSHFESRKDVMVQTDFSPTQPTRQNQEEWAYVISWALSCFLCSLSLLLQARKDLRVE